MRFTLFMLFFLSIQNLSAQVTLVKDIYAGVNSGINTNNPVTEKDRIVFNGKLIFCAKGTSGTYQLWQSDGTLAGTSILKQIATNNVDSNPKNFTIFNSTSGTKLYFSANNGANNFWGINDELWQTDGTTAGTVINSEMNQATTSSPGSFPRGFIVFGSNFYFTANVSPPGEEFYRNDGSLGGATLVRDINPGAANSSPKNFTVANGKLFFAATNDNIGRELYVAIGPTTASLSYIDVLPVANIGSNPLYLTEYNNNVYFTAGVGGDQLWKSDGTIAGTSLITDFSISAGDPQDYYVSPTLGLMFFSAATNATGREMHYVATDDDEGVYNETNIGSGDGIRAGTQFIEYNGDVYFTATNGTSGYELWRTNHLIDGSPLTMVKDINATGDSNPVNFIVFGGKLIFQANDGIHGAELWKSDGTTSGTTLVTDINTGVESSSPAGFVALNSNVLLFTATEATVGAELWKLNNSGLSNTTSDFDENSIQIYPNPATNEINVSNTRNSGISTITIMDVNGRTIKQNTFNNFSNVQVNIAELSKGVYLMKINLEAGIVTKKIVKN
mgnify:FL=1